MSPVEDELGLPVRCEAVEYFGSNPYPQQCEETAEVRTEEGSCYCDEHKNWDD